MRRSSLQNHLIKMTQSFKKGLINIMTRYLNTFINPKPNNWVIGTQFEPAN
jgi:hypothetical protein